MSTTVLHGSGAGAGDALAGHVFASDLKSQVTCETVIWDNMEMIVDEITSQVRIDYEMVMWYVVSKIGFESYVENTLSVDGKGLCARLARCSCALMDSRVWRAWLDIAAGRRPMVARLSLGRSSRRSPRSGRSPGKLRRRIAIGKVLTKGGLVEAIVAETELEKQEATIVLDSLALVAAKQVKSAGKVTIWGLCMVKARVKPAVKAGKWERFDRTVIMKAKPAKTVVKAFWVVRRRQVSAHRGGVPARFRRGCAESACVAGRVRGEAGPGPL